MKPTLAMLALLLPMLGGVAAEADAPPAAEMDGRHDFDFFIGTWTIQNHVRKPGAEEAWTDFTSTTTDRAFLGGMGNMDEMTLPHDGRGASLRFFDPAKKEWSIYWATSSRGQLEVPPVIGGFHNGVGLFYTDDVDAANKPIKVRFTWTRDGADALHWNEAVSSDQGTTWRIMWKMDFTRA